MQGASEHRNRKHFKTAAVQTVSTATVGGKRADAPRTVCAVASEKFVDGRLLELDQALAPRSYTFE